MNSNTFIGNMENKVFKVIKVSKTEFELDNGDVYPHTFDIPDDITVEEFQKILTQTKESIIEHFKKVINNE